MAEIALKLFWSVFYFVTLLFITCQSLTLSFCCQSLTAEESKQIMQDKKQTNIRTSLLFVWFLVDKATVGRWNVHCCINVSQHLSLPNGQKVTKMSLE